MGGGQRIEWAHAVQPMWVGGPKELAKSTLDHPLVNHCQWGRRERGSECMHSVVGLAKGGKCPMCFICFLDTLAPFWATSVCLDLPKKHRCDGTSEGSISDWNAPLFCLKIICTNIHRVLYFIPIKWRLKSITFLYLICNASNGTYNWQTKRLSYLGGRVIFWFLPVFPYKRKSERSS